MLDPWTYVWSRFDKLVLDDFVDGKISEEEMERRLDDGEKDNDYKRLIKYAKTLGYMIKMPK